MLTQASHHLYRGNKCSKIELSHHLEKFFLCGEVLYHHIDILFVDMNLAHQTFFFCVYNNFLLYKNNSEILCK